MVRVFKQARLLQYLLQFCTNVIDAEFYVHRMGRLVLLCRKEVCCTCRITVANGEEIVDNGCKIYVTERLCSIFSLLFVNTFGTDQLFFCTFFSWI